MATQMTPGGITYWDDGSTFSDTTASGTGDSLLKTMALSVDAAVAQSTVTATEGAAAAVPEIVEGMLTVTIEGDDAVGGIVTEAEQRTWLETNAKGEPSRLSVSRAAPVLAEKISPLTMAKIGVENVSSETVAWAVADSVGRASELVLGPDGRVVASTLAAWSARMGVDSGSRPKAVVQHGDSMTQRRDPAQLASMTGATVVQDGAGGELSVGISARANGSPLTFQPFTIPADTSAVDITYRTAADDVTQWMLLQGGRSLSGALVLPDGTRVRGTLSLVQTTMSSAHQATDRYAFARSTAGTAVTVARPAPFYTDRGEQTRNSVQVIWAGQNDFLFTDLATASDRVIREVEAILEHTGRDRYLILGVTTGTAHTRGTPAHAARVEHNRRLARYGRRHIDVRRYLIDWGLADAGLTPTAEDQADIAADTIPRSLLADGLHLTTAGDRIVDQLIATRLNELGDLA